MEESCEMHSEDDKTLSEKNKKRTVKTRAQIEALEKFYDEHKYPSETLKLEVAKRIGLTEKQVSSWFCHRRLKDKKLLQGDVYTNGRQDRSSGVIQDLGSGLRQDSCGSTKQGDEKNYDPREVESRRLAGQELSAPDLIYEHGSHYIGNVNRMDDTSSGSNSSLRNMYFKGDPADMATSRYGTQNLSIAVKGGKARSGPSGYLKLKTPVENPAITAVKRQLGRHYMEDGPPLGIEFDPLPPGAFESSAPDSVNEYDEEHAQHHSPDVPKIHPEHLSKVYIAEERIPPQSADASMIRKQPISGTGYGYISKVGSHHTDLDGQKHRIMHGPDHSENFSRQKPEQKFSSYRNRSGDVCEGSAVEISRGLNRAKYETVRAISDNGVFGTDSVVGHHRRPPYDGEDNQKRPRTLLPDNNDKFRKITRGDRFHSNSSDLTMKGRKDTFLKDEGRSRKVAKVDKIFRERRVVDEVQLNILPKNEMRNFQRAKVEFPDQQYVARASREATPQWSNHQIIRPVPEMPSSSSEDESGDTNSSLD